MPADVAEVAAGWYLSRGLSLREIEERLAQRNIEVDRATVNRWVHRLRSRIDASRTLPHGRASGTCRLDGSQVAVRGEPRWFYRALDDSGHVVDVYLSRERDDVAARRFFEHAGELRVWDSESEAGDGDGGVSAGTVAPPAEPPAVPADGGANCGSVAEEPEVVDQNPIRQGHIAPWVRSKRRRPADGEDTARGRASKIIDADVVPAPSSDVEKPDPQPAPNARVQAWIRGARNRERK